jgi:hypothetical protein
MSLVAHIFSLDWYSVMHIYMIMILYKEKSVLKEKYIIKYELKIMPN